MRSSLIEWASSGRQAGMGGKEELALLYVMVWLLPFFLPDLNDCFQWLAWRSEGISYHCAESWVKNFSFPIYTTLLLPATHILFSTLGTVLSFRTLSSKKDNGHHNVWKMKFGNTCKGKGKVQTICMQAPELREERALWITVSSSPVNSGILETRDVESLPNLLLV